MSSFWKIFISVVVTAGIIGGGIFYVMQKQIDKINSDNLAKSEELTKQIATLKSTTSTATTTPTTTDETASWKTYTNSTYGFSFKYPSTWNITADERSTSEPVYDVIFDMGNNKAYDAASRQMWINIYKTSDAAPTTLAQEKTTIQDSIDRGFRSTKISDLKIGGQDAVSYNYTDSKNQEMGNLQYSVINSSTFYHLSFYNNSATASKILATFQFTK